MNSVIKKIIPAAVKVWLRKQLIGHDIHTYYFSQWGEDTILHSVFSYLIGNITQYRGVFIDVGAYDPVQFSNTYFFYLNGWSGINIDPRPGCMENFKRVRPRDTNLEIGISGSGGPLTYYSFGEDSTLNSCSRENLEQLGLVPFIQKECLIETYPLATVLGQYLKSPQIDLLNIDAEGMDLEILQSNNWEKFRPKVICVELTAVQSMEDVLKHETCHFLKQLHYTPYAKNYITEKVSSVIFVDDML